VLGALLVCGVAVMVGHGSVATALDRLRGRRVRRARAALLAAARSGRADEESAAELAAVSQERSLGVLD
jgi:hypothetical protein